MFSQVIRHPELRSSTWSHVDTSMDVKVAVKSAKSVAVTW